MAEDFGTLKPAFHRVVGDPDSDLHGFVVIDDFVSGHGTGGIRCTENVSLDEVARLAREMTYKFAFLHLPSGGAKAGIVAKAGLSAEQRRKLFFGFGEEIGDLIRDGKYIGGLDMGASASDIEALMAGAGIPTAPDSQAPDIDSNYFTALTVFASANALLEARGQCIRESKVLIEGIGKVGIHLIQLMHDAGAIILGVSTLAGAIYDPKGLNVDILLKLREEAGDDCVQMYPHASSLPPSELFLQEADLLVPGGGKDSINESNIDKIAVRFIVPIANISASTKIEAKLHERKIFYIPGFVSNSGGVFCWHLAKLSPTAREDILRRGFKSRIARLVRQADRSNQSIAETARQIAIANLAALKRADRGGAWFRLTSLLHQLSPKRIGYVIGSKFLGADWSRS